MKVGFSALQWMAFMVAGTIVAPIAIADLFGLNPAEAAGLVQRTIFVLGISSLLQGFFGHRLPINEGPAGLWWGVFAIYAGLSTSLFSSAGETLQALEGAMLVSGAVFILLSIFKLIDRLALLFTPVVSGVYLLLLILQLSGSFFNGMLGIGYRKDGVDMPVFFFCLALVIAAFYLSKHRIRAVSQYSILISLAGGWLLFFLFGLSKEVSISGDSVISMPELFAFGPPKFDAGMTVTAVFVTLLLLTNMIASIRVADEVLKKEGEKTPSPRFKASGFVSGVNQLLGGVFSAIGPVPISGSAGFIATTKITKLIPFIIGAAIITAASFFPALMSFFASLPAPVGYSVTFVVFANMAGIAFGELDKEKETGRIRLVAGISLLAGVGAMFVPPEAFEGVSPLITSFLNNGLIFGSVIAITADQITKRVYGRQSGESR
ncbi:purine/pyrimidine permease [Bacillus sp. UMB0728]|uniref:purine/pyrimidine permease n=1 Tax=Bacillus sp. UMB0728 TaxID=2066052 RepID=UPI000C7867A8|nr:purine/pyrimidine permease [Bacillus sp. UMB0728]PLR74438.1 purine permease [Bacillus sp. UMB0728]